MKPNGFRQIQRLKKALDRVKVVIILTPMLINRAIYSRETLGKIRGLKEAETTYLLSLMSHTREPPVYAE